jgi:hypothetical protein
MKVIGSIPKMEPVWELLLTVELLMQNNLFREAKQNWHLENPPKKTREGVFVQLYMVMAMKALTSAFLMW